MRTISIFIIAIICLLVITSCNNSSGPNYDNVNVEITKETLADQLGDKNGSASIDELNYVEEYFNIHNQMWVITKCMNTEGLTIRSEEVKVNFIVQSSAYSSQENLRDENRGLSIRTPWIGITVIEENKAVLITRTFRSPGPNFALADWEEIKIIK